MSSEEWKPARPHCLPGCDRLDGHDGRDDGACMGPGGVVLRRPWTGEQAQAWAQRQQWKFAGYYKYRFTFTAEEPGITGSASSGGDSGDIYRYSVNPVMTWENITGAETDLRVTHADGTVLYDRDDVPF